MPRIQATEVEASRFVPLVTITLEVNGSVVGGFGVVDSGADMTMLPAAAVEACGLAYADIPAAPSAGQGAGGGFEFKMCQATLRYEKRVICKEVAVADPQHQLPWALLGRREFFTKYVVRFAWHRNPPDFNIDPVK